MMKRVVIFVALVAIAGIAGLVRSHSHIQVGMANHSPSGEVREEIRKNFELAPGAQVEVAGINGSVNVETSDNNKADVYVERIGDSPDALSRRQVIVEADLNGLRIRGEKGNVGFFARLFGHNPTERITLKLPRKISFSTKGVNGQVVVGDVDGSVEVRGVNGRVQIASAVGTADFKGINGNIQVGLRSLSNDGVNISGINGNIELQLSDGLNADLDAHGMNGRVVSELPEVKIDKSDHGNYSARIGTGGSPITAKGINGNIRLTRGSANQTSASVVSGQ